MSKASRKLLLACLTIAVCLTLLAAGTYALFSAQFEVTTHLAAGNLKVELYRTELQLRELDDDGYITDLTIDDTQGGAKDGLDFSDKTSENIFGINKNDEPKKFAPDCYYQATMKLKNNGTVAVTYWVEIKLNGTSNELAQQLTVTITSGDFHTDPIHLSEAADGVCKIGDTSETGLGVVVSGESNISFTVKVAFDDDANNNAAMDQTAAFDLVVHVTQYVGEKA